MREREKTLSPNDLTDVLGGGAPPFSVCSSRGERCRGTVSHQRACVEDAMRQAGKEAACVNAFHCWHTPRRLLNCPSLPAEFAYHRPHPVAPHKRLDLRKDTAWAGREPPYGPPAHLRQRASDGTHPSHVVDRAERLPSRVSLREHVTFDGLRGNYYCMSYVICVKYVCSHPLR